MGNRLPASTRGLPKSARDSMSTTRKALAMPGRLRGRVTLRKVCILPAPTFMAASSRVGFSDSSTPFRAR